MPHPPTLQPSNPLTRPVRVIQLGLGPIGLATVRLVLEKAKVQIVGAVDIDPSKIGKDLSQILGREKPLGITVHRNLRDAAAQTKADVVLHTAGSRLPEVAPQLTQIIEAGLHCVSSAEELLFPFPKHPKLAEQLDAAAKQAGVSLLGTGVNPGFVMDALPVAMSAACQRVDEVRITRIVDVSTRRLQLQRKVGIGMTEQQCRQLIKEGKFGHVGMTESAALVAHALGWPHSAVHEETRVLIAEQPIQKPNLSIPKGGVKGMAQIATAKVLDRIRVTLNLEMSADAVGARDEIEIIGVPPLRVVIPGGTAGDLATPAILVNTAPQILQAPRGLVTLLDVMWPKLVK